MPADEPKPDLATPPGVTAPPRVDPTADSLFPPEQPDVAAPREIGPYRILQQIGEGGFGYVYMAQQTHPVKRRVAVKVLKPGMDSKQVLGRFEGERHALGLMDHPNIARVLDAGATAEGRPFFVMELVKGVPITEYCDAANLTTIERLELFTTVCDALQHAHQKGVVHRDVKPSNVLVTLHDDKPMVKVIDFGIAKALNQDLTDATVFTEYRQFIGTPAYMAPEQAVMSGLDVDTRSDVYSLGVLLYELITGVTPLEAAQLRGKSVGDVQKLIKEYEPARPSTRIAKATREESHDSTGHTGTLAEQIARQRRTDVPALRRTLSGELDWIALKCLEKDRRRRYESAAALGEDVRRYLRDEPITARPATAAYRFRKFARRNRLALGAAGGVATAMLLTVVALAYGLNQAQMERDRTAEHETEARAKMLLSTMNAVRTYTTATVRPALQAKAGSYADFKPEMVPAYSARQVFERFRANDDNYRTFAYKEASTNPTNPSAKADAFEQGLIQSFVDNRASKELQGVRLMEGKPHLFVARPMVITDAACLDCHTTPEKAPPRQVELYGTTGGYGWEMGQVVAAQVVYVPVSEGFRAPDTKFRNLLIGLAGVFVVGGLGAAILLRRA